MQQQQEIVMTFPVIPRHSTTLMLAVRTQLTNQQSVPSVGYKLLMLQRGSNMKFMVRTLALYPAVSEVFLRVLLASIEKLLAPRVEGARRGGKSRDTDFISNLAKQTCLSWGSERVNRFLT